MAAPELTADEVAAFGAIAERSPMLARHLADCELGLPVMLALRDAWGLRLGVLYGQAGKATAVYFGPDGEVWETHPGVERAELRSLGRLVPTPSGNTLDTRSARRTVNVELRWDARLPYAERLASNGLQTSGRASD